MEPNVRRDVPFEVLTERLVIRGPEAGIGSDLHSAIMDSYAELHQWMPWVTSTLTVEEVEAEVIRANERFMNRDDLRYHIFLQSTGEIIGGTGLHRIDWTIPKFEIGYWIHSHHTHKGYARESTAALTELALKTLGARRVEIRVDPRNERSAAIPKTLGYEYEGTHRNCMPPFPDEVEPRSLMVFSKVR